MSSRLSFLDGLDCLHGSPIDTVVCRHEGSASYTAEADGKMNQIPGIAMVPRGPGAANHRGRVLPRGVKANTA